MFWQNEEWSVFLLLFLLLNLDYNVGLTVTGGLAKGKTGLPSQPEPDFNIT